MLVNNNITAACAQIEPVFGDTKGNLDLICLTVQQAQADLVVFPELATSGYEFRDSGELIDLALDIEGGNEIARLREISADIDSYIVLGLPERVGEEVYNSAVLIEPDGKTHVYRKLHLFDREKLLFTRGDLPITVYETRIGRIGMMICFDWIFPETARTLALAGCQIICHPSNLVLAYCQRAMFARSVENGVFTITCNRTGRESRVDRNLEFTGGSQILSNRGDVLAQASKAEAEVVKAVFNPTAADNKMIAPYNHLMLDRRVEHYFSSD